MINEKQKYHTVGTYPKSSRKIVERGKISVGTYPKSSRKIVERAKIDIPSTHMLLTFLALEQALQ
jgi:hypothetical protein